MDFLTLLTLLFYGIMLRQLNLPPTPVIVHHPIVEQSFTIDEVKVGATVTKPTKTPLKPESAQKQAVKVGGTGSQPTYFAHITNGIVDEVIVIDQATLNTGKWGNPSEWIETSMDGSIRKNGAGKGYAYDKIRDAFIAPKPKNSIGFDEMKARWISPLETSIISATTTLP